MISLRFMRLTHAGGTIYNAGEVAAFSEAVARAIVAAGHAVEHDLGLGETKTEEPAAGEPLADEADAPEPTVAPAEPAASEPA